MGNNTTSFLPSRGVLKAFSIASDPQNSKKVNKVGIVIPFSKREFWVTEVTWLARIYIPGQYEPGPAKILSEVQCFSLNL